MASSMTKATAVSIFADYYNKLNNLKTLEHNGPANEMIRGLVADVQACLAVINTDGSYSINFTEPRYTIVPYSGGRPFKVRSGQAISFSVTKTGGETSSAAVYTATGLPAWLTLNSSTGAFSGTAPDLFSYTMDYLTAGEYALLADVYPPTSLSVKNAFGEAVNGPLAMNFVVVHASSPVVSSGATGTGTVGSTLSTYTVTASGTPTSFSAFGLDQLNAGTDGTVAIDSSTGAITGTLGSGVVAGTYTVYVCATNAYGEGVDKAVVFTISDPE